MFGQDAKRCISSDLKKFALSAAMAAAVGYMGNVSAQESGTRLPAAVVFASLNVADLEAAFWACEYAATTRGTASIQSCAAVYDALKERKFGGDFDGLLKWWQLNRVSAYRRLAAEDDQLALSR